MPRPAALRPPHSVASPVASRRILLLGGLAALTAGSLAGCSLTDPVVHGAAAEVTPSPTPTIPADQVAAAARLSKLASWCTVAATAAPKQYRSAAAAAARGFADQAQVLGRPDPFAGPASAAPSPSPSGTAPATADLVTAIGKASKAAADEFATAALQAPSQELRLLWLSLCLSARAAGSLTRPLQASPAQPARFTDVAASQRRSVLVEQLYRAAYAHEACAGALPGGEVRTRVMTELTDLQSQIATEQALLRADQVEVPAQHPGYQLPARPTAKNTSAVLAAVSRDLLDARAGLASALTGEDSSAELAKATTLIGTVQGWGGQVTVWPGWVS